MCGIVGVLHPKVTRAWLEVLADAMHARGPDGSGFYAEPGVAMGMRRLSIIDLESGWQPLFSGEGSIVAFQNGEIYNYRELREELLSKGYAFATRSDTEVLAHGYHAWGVRGLAERLDGMFAAAILDRKARVLHLVRDRLGEKPLFCAAIAGGFAYASDLRLLAALPGVDRGLNLPALQDYLALHFVPGRHTIVQGVWRVLPGEILSLDLDGRIQSRLRYYRPPVGEQRRVGDQELAAALEHAVRSRLVADVPVGVFLSGGLDSSIVAAIAAAHNPRIATFSMGFKSAAHDESEFAREVAAYIDSDHHHFVFDEAEFLDLLPRAAAALDEPLGDQALLPVYWLCGEARKHVKVVLAGEGADEIFAGYSYYSRFSEKPTWRDRLSAFRRGRALRTAFPDRLVDETSLATASGFPLLTDVAGRTLLTNALPHARDEWEDDLVAWLRQSSDPLQRATCADLTTWLPDDLLVKFDRMAMAHSLEGRAPYLDPAIVEMGVARLRAADRMCGSASKIALRRVAKRWLPDGILNRKKQGFILPMRDWIARWAERCGDVGGYFAQAPRYGDSLAVLGNQVAESIRIDPGRERFHFAALMLAEWAWSFDRKVSDLADAFAAFLVTSSKEEHVSNATYKR